MIWCIIGVTLFILAVVFYNIAKICYNNELNDKKRIVTSDFFETLSIISGIISFIIIATCSVLILHANAGGKFEVEEARDRRNVYIMLLKENKDITVQNQLYKDIVTYNATIRKKKHYSKSLWTNWFYAKGWDELEYIEINNYNIQEENDE